MGVFDTLRKKHVKAYVHKRMRENGVKTISNMDIDRLIASHESNPLLNGRKMKFSAFIEKRDQIKCQLSALNTVIVSSEWAYQLLIHRNDDYVTTSFLLSLGHELNHTMKWFPHTFNPEYDRFIRWCVEVHHDFAGAKIMGDGKRKNLLISITHKMLNRPHDEDSILHPSWKRRYCYAENYNFDEELIRRIAEDTEYQNEELILDMIAYYKPIVLR